MGSCSSKNATVVSAHDTVKDEPAARTAQAPKSVPREAANPNANSNGNTTFRPPAHPASGTRSNKEYTPGYSSGASTPSALDRSSHSNTGLGNSTHNPKILTQSSSVLGLDKMISDRKELGDLKNNIVHMEVPFGKPIEEVYDGVHDGPVLGSGISGLVRLCVHRDTKAKYAVKCLDLGLVETEEGIQQLREEIAIMCQLDHPNIVRLEEVYESRSEIYLVQELCVGGELFDRLDEQPDYHYTESQCALLVKQMLCSVRYCHSKGIIHRDLKLENFLFSTNSPDSELKMIDFGLSKHFKYGETHHEAVGTPYTVAPEVIEGSYDERCDVWAIGVITYLLLSGDPPFGGCGGPESLMEVRSNILAGRFSFEPTDIWDHVSQCAKDFIKKMLVTEPTNRPTARTCQRDEWIHLWANKGKKEGDNILNKEVVKALVNFKEYSDMRKLLCEVLSFTLLPDQIADLRKEFSKLDIDGSGEISLKGLKQVLMRGAGAGSLGALTEEEIEDIFNAMRVRKSETRIHWHEFIAAGLSQCKVDERNLKLAFDRLDADHKGYVTFDNIMDMMGRDGAESEDEMRDMWASSMKACKVLDSQVTYQDFLLLMKGQTMPTRDHSPRTSQSGAPLLGLIPMLPGATMPLIQPSLLQNGNMPLMQRTVLQNGNLDVLHELSDSNDTDEDTELELEHLMRRNSEPSEKRLSASFPMPTSADPSFDNDMPITMDDDDDKLDEIISENADKAMALKYRNLTPPQTPVRGPTDFITPISGERFKISPESFQLSQTLPSLPDTRDFSRRRSKSVDDQDYMTNDADAGEPDQDAEPQITSDIRRAMILPEHTHMMKNIDAAIQDENLTPLVVNRKLYRAHRQMRLAVVEASKRFEDQQLIRTKEELQAKHDADARPFVGAGLVMRRGNKKEVSSGEIRHLMSARQKQTKSIIESAARKGGRGRRSRKKTISDMSGMLLGSASPPPSQAATSPPPETKSIPEEPPEKELKLHDITKPEPTVPGVFRKTNDPFRWMGKIADAMGEAFDKDKSQYTKPAGASGRSASIDCGSLHNSNSNIKVSVSDGELNTMTPAESP
jgi:calcium-dependent protein kinase